MVRELEEIAAKAIRTGHSLPIETNIFHPSTSSQRDLPVSERQLLPQDTNCCPRGSFAPRDLLKTELITDARYASSASAAISQSSNASPSALSGSSHSSHSFIASNQVAVLVDTASGQHRRLTRPRPTLTQTLSKLQLGLDGIGDGSISTGDGSTSTGAHADSTCELRQREARYTHLPGPCIGSSHQGTGSPESQGKVCQSDRVGQLPQASVLPKRQKQDACSIGDARHLIRPCLPPEPLARGPSRRSTPSAVHLSTCKEVMASEERAGRACPGKVRFADD